jgi:hypothetical protein
MIVAIVLSAFQRLPDVQRTWATHHGFRHAGIHRRGDWPQRIGLGLGRNVAVSDALPSNDPSAGWIQDEV